MKGLLRKYKISNLGITDNFLSTEELDVCKLLDKYFLNLVKIGDFYFDSKDKIVFKIDNQLNLIVISDIVWDSIVFTRKIELYDDMLKLTVDWINYLYSHNCESSRCQLESNLLTDFQIWKARQIV